MPILKDLNFIVLIMINILFSIPSMVIPHGPLTLLILILRLLFVSLMLITRWFFVINLLMRIMNALDVVDGALKNQ